MIQQRHVGRFLVFPVCGVGLNLYSSTEILRRSSEKSLEFYPNYMISQLKKSSQSQSWQNSPQMERVLSDWLRHIDCTETRPSTIPSRPLRQTLPSTRTDFSNSSHQHDFTVTPLPPQATSIFSLLLLQCRDAIRYSWVRNNCNYDENISKNLNRGLIFGSLSPSY
jgi:hypothetical protein